MTPGPEDEVSQAEKARVIREQASSILDHARAAANDLGGGRFAGVNPTTVIGAEPAVRYPAASSSWQIQLPDEPPTGYRIDAMSEFESSMAPPVEATDDPANAPSGGSGSAPSGGQVSERAGSSPFPTDQDENQ